MSAVIEKLAEQDASIELSHKLGIGGSNAGTILGVNEWQTPLELYQRMKGLAPKPETNDLMVMGTLSEQGLRTLFERHHGAPIRQSHKLHRHRDHHWMPKRRPSAPSTNGASLARTRSRWPIWRNAFTTWRS